MVLERSAPVDSDDVEIEWQFDALDLRPVERWLAALPLRPATPEGLPTLTAQAKPVRRLLDHYLDTEDWRIGRAGFVLRVRQRGRHEEATLKDTGSTDPSGLRTRLEVTEELGPQGIDGLSHDGPVGRRVHAVIGRRPLRPVLDVRTRRRPFSLRAGGVEVAEVALDDTLISVGIGQRPVQLRRVEVELVAPAAEGLARLVDELRASCGLQPAALSKFEAGLLALGVSVTQSPDLGPTELTPNATLGELAYAVLRRQIGVLYRKEPGTRLGEDLEELHDMRVATRRLRGALDLFSDVLPIRARALRNELGWLAETLGAVRDLDVQLERMDDEHFAVTRPEPMPGEVTSPIEDLRVLLEAERALARRALLGALDSPRYERLLNGLIQVVRHGPSRYARITRVPAAIAAPQLVARPHDRAMKAAKRAQKSGLAADFHRLRIRCKRLRYSLEFTADLYGNRTEPFTKRLARLQDKLGLMQDAEVATARLWQLGTGRNELSPPTVFAMGAVAERYRLEAATLLATMPKELTVLNGHHWRDLSELMDKRRRETPALAESNRTRPVPGLRPALSAVPDVPDVPDVPTTEPATTSGPASTSEPVSTAQPTAEVIEATHAGAGTPPTGEPAPAPVAAQGETRGQGDERTFAPLRPLPSGSEERSDADTASHVGEITRPNGHLNGA